MSDRSLDKLSDKNINEIVSLACESDHRYFMLINISGRRSKFWMGFKDSIENEYNQYYVLYRKIRISGKTVYACMEIWDRMPRQRDIFYLMSFMRDNDNNQYFADQLQHITHYRESDDFVLAMPPARKDGKSFQSCYFDFV